MGKQGKKGTKLALSAFQQTGRSWVFSSKGCLISASHQFHGVESL